MTIYRPGAEVTANGEVAKITTVSITELGVAYEIGYWKSGEWKTCWIPESEIGSVDESKTKTLGFKP